MWVTNLVIVFITFVALLVSSIKIQRRTKEHVEHAAAVARQTSSGWGSSTGGAGDGVGGARAGDTDADSDESLLIPGSEEAVESNESNESTSLLIGGGGGGRKLPKGGRGGGGGALDGVGGITAGWEGVGIGDVGTLQTRGDRTNYLLPNELRHTVFVTYELCCMLLALVDPTLAVVRNDTATRSGPIIELNFADVALASAQGVMLFLCFGLEDALWLPVTAVFNRFAASIRKMVYSTESDELARIRQWQSMHGDLSQVKIHCEAIQGMKDVCMRELARTRRYHLRTYKDVFTGTEMINFLLEKGLIDDRYAGLDFGRDLLIGDVIVHVSHEHHFHDCEFFYRFCTQGDFRKKQRSSSMTSTVGDASPSRARKTSSITSVQG